MQSACSAAPRLTNAHLTDLRLAAQQASYVNPAQTVCQSAFQPGSSSSSSTSSSPAVRRKASMGTKRKRSPQDASTSVQPRVGREGPKKKKANRACFHCQKAHLTCDDSRPCQRCVKRGLGNNCTEGHRKKAKYLLDDEELEQLKRNTSNPPPAAAVASDPPPVQPTPTHTYTHPDPVFNVFSDAPFTFGSEAANLEYSILTAILGTASPDMETVALPPHQQQQQPQQAYNAAWPAEYGAAAAAAYASAYGEPLPLMQPPPENSSSAAAYTNISAYASSSAGVYQPRPGAQPPDGVYAAPLGQEPPEPGSGGGGGGRAPPKEDAPLQLQQPITLSGTALVTPPRSTASPTLPLSGLADPQPLRPSSALSSSQLQSINDRVTVPYDYTEGYHFLMKHLRSRFEKNDILRIVRALAIFRPSFIALQAPLSVEDEIFVEKCFQRSLVELDKLISFSGTPTVVWRRTGEICLVAPEFCHLTDWSMAELLGRKTYIYELFEHQSVVEYWESFASHAFENTTQSAYLHCVLLKPDGAPIPSTFCFSIRRDMFDLPSMVIGQWLPLL